MKICLDAGHYGKYNQSPCNKNYYESDMTWKLHLFLKSALESKGFEVITTRNNQANDLSLTTRGKKSKGCDLFLSIHSNAGNASACTALACTTVNGKSNTLGKALADKVTQIMLNDANKSGSIWQRKGNGGSDYYGVLRGAVSVGTMAILLEHGYHTNVNNTEWLLNPENLQKLAIAETEIIADYFRASSPAPTTANSALPYTVKILDDALNIRKSAGMNGDIVGTITNHAVYTIVEEASADGVTWGKLKSGAGWISLHEKYAKKV